MRPLLLIALLAVPVWGQIPAQANIYRARLTREARAAWGLEAPVALFAAQVHQESGWREDARSSVGALGRLVEVHEPAPGSTGGTSGAGWVRIDGTEQSTIGSQEVCDFVWNPELMVFEWQCWWEQTTIYDEGRVSLTVNGLTKSVSYGQGSTGSTIATALANAFNNDSASPVTASASTNTVNLTAKTTGAATNYPLSATSWTDKPEYFSGPSFTPVPSGSTLTGGTDGSSTPTYSLATPAVTLYTYDTLDNLTCVVQKGTDTTPFSSCASATAPNYLRMLARKRCMRLLDRSVIGSRAEVYLPDEIARRWARAPRAERLVFAQREAARDAAGQPRAWQRTDDVRSLEFRLRIREREAGRCFYCLRRLQRKEWTPDHVVPLGRGGADHAANLVACCATCNWSKGPLPAEEFLRRLVLRKILPRRRLRGRMRALVHLRKPVKGNFSAPLLSLPPKTGKASA